MDLKLYKAKSITNLEKIENKLNELNYYINSKEEVGVFNFSKINENTYHIIFYIKEEYHTGTKYISAINKIPMDIYINTFFILDKNYILIEKLYNEYFKLILDKYKTLFGIESSPVDFQNTFFLNLIRSKIRKVLHCDLDIDGYIKSVENKESTLDEILSGSIVDFITFTLDRDGLTKVITSINKKGIITSKATTPIMLINIIEIILDGNNV
ncbi:hypothetical protein ACLD43_15245 [Clostridium botulinum]|uniref:hypothetical protein n=1 Tax=Clostridium botulinum TaxID=1491 RepID=UPI003A7FF846